MITHDYNRAPWGNMLETPSIWYATIYLLC